MLRIGDGIVLIGQVRDFLLPLLGFELGISGSQVLHSTTVPQWLLALTSDNFRYFILVQTDSWWYCSHWTMRDYLLVHTGIWTGTTGCSILPMCTVTSVFHPWQFQVFNNGTEGLVVILFWLIMQEIFILPKLGFELGIVGSHVLHSTTIQQWIQVFTSNTLRYLTLV